MPGDDVLREMLRELERILDQQLRAVEEQDDRAEQAITLAVATLGGGLGLATLLSGALYRDGVSLAFLGVSAGVNLASLAWLLRAYMGVPKALQVGPRPTWLRDKANDAGWTVQDHLLSMVTDVPDYCLANADILRRRASIILRGVWMLLLALAGYAIVTLYILGRGVAW